jgi:hypothetical protein
LPIYPKILTFYAALERRIKNICLAEKDRRHDLFALAKCYSGRLANKHRDMIEESQFHSVPERSTSNNSNNTGTNMNPIVPSTIDKTNHVNHHPILSDNQSTTSRTTPKDSLNSNSTARSTNDKPVNVVGTGNGSTTAQKSASPVPSSQSTAPTSSSTTTARSGSTNNTERSTTKVKPEPVISNSSSTNAAATTTTATSTKSSRVAHGPSLPSSKIQVTSTTPSKNESNETSSSTSGRTIKLSNNGSDRHESSPQTSTVSTTRESPPTSKKETSTMIDRRPTSSTTDQQQSSNKSSASPVSRATSSRTFTSSTRTTSSAATVNDDSVRRSDQAAINGSASLSLSTSSKNIRTESPHEHAPVEKRTRGSTSKSDRNVASHVEEPQPRNGSSRSAHRDHKHESNKRARSSTPEKRSSNGSAGGNSSSSSRRLNQTAESTLSTTPVHQDNEHSSTSGIMDVSPSSLSTKRIKTTDAVSNGRSARKEAREERHASSSSSHRVSSSSSRSDRREKYHSSKEPK